MSNVPEYKVSEISYLIKRKLENDFGYIQVKGEISDLKLWNGHYLFNLKDEESVLASRIWKNKVPMLNFKPEEGLEITATGKISTHIKRSSYNLLIDNIHATSEGELLKLIELRKKKLQKKGIFNNSRPLPLLPDRIAIVTSLTGAVIEDIKKKTETLVQASMKLGEAIYKSQQNTKPESNKDDGKDEKGKKDDNVVDADFEEVKDENKEKSA